MKEEREREKEIYRTGGTQKREKKIVYVHKLSFLDNIFLEEPEAYR